MRQKEAPLSSKTNLIFSLLIALGAAVFFIFFSDNNGSGRSVGVSGAGVQKGQTEAKKSPLTSSSTQNVGSVQSNEAVPGTEAGIENAAGKLSHPVPYRILPAEPAPEPGAAASLAAQLQMQVQVPSSELPEDLKRQLNSAPPEVPEDLRRQLNAPPPEIPEDIKRQMAMPPRRVSIDEVNDPNFNSAKGSVTDHADEDELDAELPR